MADLPRGPRRGLAVIATVAIALVALPVIGQQSTTEPAVPPSETDAPRSILPEGFETPPPPTQTGPLLAPDAPLVGTPPPLITAPAPTEGPVDPFAVAIPTGRDITVFGPLRPEAGGFGPGIFERSRGPFLAGLANRINRPIASRWATIMLRRALLSESRAPAQIGAGDWVAARAWLLMRLGEIDGAKALTDAVPVDRYSRELYRVAGQVSLAAADIGGLCPLAATGQLLSKDPMWQLAVGMCAALQGDDITAAGIFDQLREKNKSVDPFDVRLAERVATLAGGAGRATNIDWDEAPAMTPFRYGVATATGVAVPPERLEALGPARFGWLVRAAALAPDVRLAALAPAAAIGSVSAAELVSGIAAQSSGTAAADTRAGRLRTAAAGASFDDRRAALRAIWAATDSGGDAYAALIESAPAAVRLPVAAASAAESAQLIAALLSIGNVDAARRWWPVADKADAKVRATAWALLATGSGGIPTAPSDFDDWRSASGADARRAAMVFAALAGLGASSDGDWDDLREELLPRTVNSWTRAIDAAAAAGRGGEVMLLAATALQGPWSEVPPLHVYHIIAALVRTGHSQEARQIAAEAVTRS